MRIADTTAAPSAVSPREPSGVPRRNKIGIAGGEAGLVVSGVVFNTWSLFFLINIAGVPGWQAGVLFLLARLFDAVNDPFLGDLIDRQVDRRPRLWWVRRFSLPASALFVVFFALPFAPGPVLVYLLVALCISSVATTLTSTAVISLIPILARSYDERTGLVSWRVAAGTAVSLVGISGPPVIVLAVTGDSDLAASDPSGWIVMGALFGLLMLVGLTVAAVAIRVPAGGEIVARQRLSVDLLRRLWRLSAFRSVFAMVLVTTLAIIVGTATLPFFLGSVLGMDATQQSVVLGGFFLVAVLSIPLAGRLARRVGKPRALAASVAVYAVGLLLFAFLQPRFDQPLLVLLVVLVAGVGFAGVLVLPNAMVPDVAEFIEEETGERRESLLLTLMTFAAKVGGSLGVFAVALLTSLIGYENGQSVQSEGTQLGLALIVGPLQVVLYALAGWWAWRSPLTRAGFEAVVARVQAGEGRPPGPVPPREAAGSRRPARGAGPPDR